MAVGGSSYANAVESQWSHLPNDILKVIANRLNNCLDVGSSDSCGALSIHNLLLRSVCKSWRSSIPRRNKKPTPTILPSDIVPNPGPGPGYKPRKGYYTLSQSTIYLLQPKQSQPPSVNTCNENYWLLRVEEEEENSSDGINSGEKWCPRNPLTRTLTCDADIKERLILPKGFPKSINLLDFRVFEIGRAYNLDYFDQTSKKGSIDEDELVRIDKVVVSSTPFTMENTDYAASDVDLVIMAICGLKLVFHKLGDEKWIPIDDPTNSGFIDVVFHRGKFYAVDYKGKVFLVGCDFKTKEITPGFDYLRYGGEYKNLVTSCGDLFMIDTFFDSEPILMHDYYMDDYIVKRPDPIRLKIYKLNEEKKEWERVRDLNDHVFFVGYDCSYSVLARDFGLKPNCAYYYINESFRDCNEENKLGEFFTGIGVYDMDAGTCGPFSKFPDHWPIFMPPTTSSKQKKGRKHKKMLLGESSSKVVDSQWSGLPGTFLKLLVKRLNNCLGVGSSDCCGSLSIHNILLRSVCKSWRSAIPIRYKETTPLIFPSKIVPNPNFKHWQGHYTLSQSTIYLLQKRTLQPSVNTSEGHYWVLRVETETSPDGNNNGENLRLRYPLSRTLTTNGDGKERLLLPKDFPKSINLLDFHMFEVGRAYSLDFVNRMTSRKYGVDDIGFVRIDKVVVSSIPFTENTYAASEVDYLAVMAICGLKLVFLKVGDDKWIPVDDPKDSGFMDVVFHQGEFYAVDYKGNVVSVGCDLKAKEIAPGVGYRIDGGRIKNLVTSGDDLYMIDTFIQTEEFGTYGYYMNDYIPQQTDLVCLKVYKLNNNKKEWERVHNLNNHAFFVGFDCSYSVFAGDFVGLRPNCVYYYVDDYFRDPDKKNKLGEYFTGIGVYDMDSGTCGPLSKFPDHWPCFMPPLTLSSLKEASKAKKRR